MTSTLFKSQPVNWRLCFAFSLIWLLAHSLPAYSQAVLLWNNATGGNWNVPANWNPAGPPTSIDDATIDLAGTYTVSISDNRAINNLILNNPNATLSQGGGSVLTVGGTITLTSGLYSLGSSVISGGSIVSGGGTLQGTTLGSRLSDVTIGNGVLDFSTGFRSVLLQGTSNFGSGATVTMSAGSTALGFEQTFTQNNLTINMTAANAAVTVNGNAVLTLGTSSIITNNIGALTTNSIASDNFVAGTSTFFNQGLIRNIGAGTLTITPDIFVNQSGGIVRSTLGTISIFRSDEVNQAGGLFDVNGGTLTISGTNWDNNGTITLSSGTVNFGGTFPTANIGTVTRTGGTIQILGTMNNASTTLALNATTGTYGLGNTPTSGFTAGIITGGSITSADGSVLRIGTSPNNRLTDVAIGVGVLDFSAASSQVRLNGTSTLAAGTVINLNSGFNVLTFDQTTTLSSLNINFTSGNGRVRAEGTNTITLGPSVTITNASGSTATLDTGIGGAGTFINQGLLLNSIGTIFNIGSTGMNFANTGTLQATGGQLRVLDVTNFSNFSAGTLSGGTYLAHGAVMSLQTRLVSTLASGTTAEISGAGGTFDALNSLASNAGTLRILGGKSFNPTNTSLITSTGLIEVGASSTLTSDLTINGGGILRGNGTVVGNVTFDTTGGTLQPGASPGILTINGNLIANSNTTFSMELNGATVGTGYDQIVAAADVTLNNAALNASLGYSPSTGDLLFILNKTSAGSISGIFNGLPDGSQVTLPGFSANISYFGDFGSQATTGGNDVVLHNFVAVPEVSSLLAIGLVLFAVFYRWQRRLEALRLTKGELEGVDSTNETPPDLPLARGGANGPTVENNVTTNLDVVS